MSELRQDPVSGHWVLIARQRSERPIELLRAPIRRPAGRCPFCGGNEQETPAAVVSYPPVDKSHGFPWQVRIVPNKYPAIDAGATTAAQDGDLFRAAPAAGVHEVIIESPEHVRSVTELTDQQTALVYRAYRDRLQQLSTRPDVAYALLFKNSGAAAGASLEHLHSQLLATPVVPTAVQNELDHAALFHRRTGHCLFCTLIQRELDAGKRVVEATDQFVALCPFASRFAYETWILPRCHASRFDQLDDQAIGQLSQLASAILRRIERAAQRPAYNWLLHTAPFDRSCHDHYHWHMEILPRVVELAGFELGAGCFINCLPPEQAAASLRSGTPPGANADPAA